MSAAQTTAGALRFICLICATPNLAGALRCTTCNDAVAPRIATRDGVAAETTAPCIHCGEADPATAHIRGSCQHTYCVSCFRACIRDFVESTCRSAVPSWPSSRDTASNNHISPPCPYCVAAREADSACGRFEWATMRLLPRVLYEQIKDIGAVARWALGTNAPQG